jgi:molybdopterin synthase catalytic subunit
MSSSRTRVTKRPIDLEGALRQARSDSAGGTVAFIGTVRNRSERGRVRSLEYQAYGRMAERRMKRIESEVRQKWPVKKVVMLHREGVLKIGDVSVVVVVSAEHRAEAFEACRYAIDRIKSTLPLWKKERIGKKGGWVEGTPLGTQT